MSDAARRAAERIVSRYVSLAVFLMDDNGEENVALAEWQRREAAERERIIDVITEIIDEEMAKVRAENERLKSEVERLREMIRLADATMTRFMRRLSP